jgi:hypothetical protein
MTVSSPEGLLLLNEPSAHQVIICVRLDLVVFQAADRSIDFQHCQSHITALRNAVLANRALQFVHADMFPRHMRFDRLPVVYQKTRLALNHTPETAAGPGKSPDQIIQHQQRGSRHHAPDQRRIRPGHRVLHGVGKKKQQREVERRHLSDLALAAEAYTNQYDQVDHTRAQCDLERNMRTRREEHSVQLAVTGVGAPFGVLRYPVALFLSTVQTTSSNSR